MKIRTILGCMEFGRFHSTTLESCQQLVSVFVEQGHYELDTALMYNGGKSEELIGQMEVCKDKTKVSVATKANPNHSDQGLKFESVIEQLETSLKRLQMDSVGLFYLHSPDHKTPIEETLQAVNHLLQGGKFQEFGLSNYSAWEVAEIYYLCKMNGWVLPTVYQGMYNAITRSVEKELLPCLKRFGIRFYAYNRWLEVYSQVNTSLQINLKKRRLGVLLALLTGETYRNRFWSKDNFENLEKIKKKLDGVYGDGQISLTSASLRWMYHHSKLSGQVGDGVILGAGSVNHLSENLKASKSEPLHADVVAAFDEAWETTKHHCPDYMR